MKLLIVQNCPLQLKICITNTQPNQVKLTEEILESLWNKTSHILTLTKNKIREHSFQKPDQSGQPAAVEERQEGRPGRLREGVRPQGGHISAGW